jgi:hypothetical protein
MGTIKVVRKSLEERENEQNPENEPATTIAQLEEQITHLRARVKEFFELSITRKQELRALAEIRVNLQNALYESRKRERRMYSNYMTAHVAAEAYKVAFEGMVDTEIRRRRTQEDIELGI